MANIKKYTDKIRKSIYGKEVRGSLADGIEAINDEVEDNTEVAVNIEKRQDAVEQQFDDLQQNYTEDSPSDAEIVAGRTNTKTGKNYSTLGKRLDDEYEETHRKIDSNHDDVTAQLAHEAQRSMNKSFYDSLGSSRKRRPIMTIVDDDGKSEFYTLIKPILEEFKVPIASALITSIVGHTPEYMSEDQ